MAIPPSAIAPSAETSVPFRTTVSTFSIMTSPWVARRDYRLPDRLEGPFRVISLFRTPAVHCGPGRALAKHGRIGGPSPTPGGTRGGPDSTAYPSSPVKLKRCRERRTGSVVTGHGSNVVKRQDPKCSHHKHEGETT